MPKEFSIELRSFERTLKELWQNLARKIRGKKKSAGCLMNVKY